MALPLWLQRLKKYNPTYSSVKTPGSTPVYGYDITIGQGGKTDREILEDWRKSGGHGSGGPSGLHPGVESGYQGGLSIALEGETPKGYWYPGGVSSKTRTDIAGGEYKNLNKIPTQTTNIVGWKNPKKQGPTAEERAEAWKLAMEDAQGFMGPMQGDTIPGVAPGGGSREHQMSVYNTGGYDLTSNRPISDTDAVRKRLYGIMGFA